MAEPVVLFVRFRRGVVGETRRTAHAVPVPVVHATYELTEIPERLTALCGQTFMPGEAERLDRPGGMPCVACLGLLSPAQRPALRGDRPNRDTAQSLPGQLRRLRR